MSVLVNEGLNGVLIVNRRRKKVLTVEHISPSKEFKCLLKNSTCYRDDGLAVESGR